MIVGPRHTELNRRMLEITARFSLLAFGIPASLQTSNFQARNRATGAAVSLIKKSDVKNHLSPRHRTQIHLCPPESQPDATGFSAAEPGTVQADGSDSNRHLDAERSFTGTALAQGNSLIGAISSGAPPKSKSVQP